jgi:hypothetical protein
MSIDFVGVDFVRGRLMDKIKIHLDKWMISRGFWNEYIKTNLVDTL